MPAPVEFQAVILASVSDGDGLFPLTDDLPTALLPVAAKSGASDAGAGALLLLATAKTALQNVRINTRGKESPRACATARRANELSALLDKRV